MLGGSLLLPKVAMGGSPTVACPRVRLQGLEHVNMIMILYSSRDLGWSRGRFNSTDQRLW